MNKKTLLFLDDDLQRHKTIYYLFGHLYVIDFTETVNQAKEKLCSKRYDVVSLDHDLDGTVMVDSGKGTGYEVSEYITTLPKDKLPQLVICHSYNPNGAFNMFSTVSKVVDSVIAPFALEEFQATLKGVCNG